MVVVFRCHFEHLTSFVASVGNSRLRLSIHHQWRHHRLAQFFAQESVLLGVGGFPALKIPRLQFRLVVVVGRIGVLLFCVQMSPSPIGAKHPNDDAEDTDKDQDDGQQCRQNNGYGLVRQDFSGRVEDRIGFGSGRVVERDLVADDCTEFTVAR